MNDDTDYWSADLRKSWNHPEYKPGDHMFLTIWAEGDELARLERVFFVRRREIVDYLIDDDEADMPPRPHCEGVRRSGDAAERLAAVRAYYSPSDFRNEVKP